MVVLSIAQGRSRVARAEARIRQIHHETITRMQNDGVLRLRWDEPLLAEGEVHFAGQPIAVVVADNPRSARRGAAAINAEYEELPGVFDPRTAAAAGLSCSRAGAPARWPLASPLMMQVAAPVWLASAIDWDGPLSSAV